MEDSKTFVVSCGKNIQIVTTDQCEAKKELAKVKLRETGTDWAIRSVEEAITHAWKEGFGIGWDDGQASF